MSPHKSDDSEDEWKKDKKDKKDKKEKKDKDKEKKDKDKKDKDKKDKEKDKKDKDKKDKHKDEKGKKDGETHKLTHPTPVDPGGVGFPAVLQMQDGHHQFSPPAGYDKSRMDPSPPSFPTAPPAFPQAPSQGGPYGAPPPFPSPPGSTAPPPFPSAPSAPQQAAPPPSGYRLPLATTSAFPDLQQAGQPPCYDADGVSPVFFGSALFPSSVHPCKIAPHLSPCVSVPYGGTEYYHNGRFDLLPYDPRSMELVLTSYGKIPPGRRPVEGGYEESGEKLYHGLAFVNGVKVPGKTGEHLGACNVSFGGAEVAVAENYEILCWR